MLFFLVRIKSLLPPNSASESFIIHHPDRIYSPDHGFSRGDWVALNPLAAGRSTGSATGRTSGFSSHLCRGFAPTQPAGGMAGPAAGQPFHRSGFYVSPCPWRSSSSPCGTMCHAVWDGEQACCESFEAFSEELYKVFDNSARGIEVARALSVLHQGKQSVSAYSIEFRNVAAFCGWNEKALWDPFLHSLAEHVKDEIYSLELPAGLDKLIDLTIRVDDRIALRSRPRRGRFPRERITGATESVTACEPGQSVAPKLWWGGAYSSCVPSLQLDCNLVAVPSFEPQYGLELLSRSRHWSTLGQRAILWILCWPHTWGFRPLPWPNPSRLGPFVAHYLQDYPCHQVCHINFVW